MITRAVALVPGLAVAVVAKESGRAVSSGAI